MNQWVKLGCGHLVALPLLLFSGLCAVILIYGDHVTAKNVAVWGSIALATAGLGVGLLFYLWRDVWRRAGKQEAETSDPAKPDASTPENSTSVPATDREAGERESVVTHGEDAPEMSDTDASVGVHDGDSPDSIDGDNDEPEPTPRLGPDERPWERRAEWRDETITSHQGSIEDKNNWVIFGGGLLFIVIGVAVGIANPEKWPLTVMCSASGLLMVGIATYRMRRATRFGPTSFEMDTLPGVLGGPLCGVLHTGVESGDAPDDGFTVKLSCYRRRITRDSEGNLETNHVLLWRDEERMVPMSTSNGKTVDVPVVFDIPDGPPPSTAKKNANRYMWTVEASAAMPGIDYRSVVEIPVFPVVDDGTAPVEAYREYVQERTAQSSLSRGITLDRPHPGRLTVTFGRARRPWVALLMTVMALFFVPLTVLAALHGGIFVSILLGIFGCASIWGMLSYLTYRSLITVEDGSIRVRSGIIGRETETVIPCDALEAAHLVTSGGNAYRLFLDCRRPVKGPEDRRPILRKIVRTVSGGRPPTGNSWEDYWRRFGMTDDRVTAAQMITDHPEAEWIAAQIEEAAAESARFAPSTSG
ncbi:hypothetical protein CRI94_15495 [Longibacter salinarum]|uniref:DUF3592 domain-containing protein n=1 Tax=Longibacter salinarum TaxID=1850348 RepID=A0A2A8CU86_9BACT|nr:hypothetical protein [Longibacter salinarum]PEN11438.1 hypothetical protein CRI94_15495 [Longibacter salinarum]